MFLFSIDVLIKCILHMILENYYSITLSERNRPCIIPKSLTLHSKLHQSNFLSIQLSFFFVLIVHGTTPALNSRIRSLNTPSPPQKKHKKTTKKKKNKLNKKNKTNQNKNTKQIKITLIELFLVGGLIKLV